MTMVTAPVWLVALVVVLAICGCGALFVLMADGLGRMRDWWRDRREPLIAEDEEQDGFHIRGCMNPDCLGCDIPLELPPERSREELGFTGSGRHADDLMDAGGLWHGPYAPERERRAPWWEAENRAAYESLGFDYPSGLVARVRELTQ